MRRALLVALALLAAPAAAYVLPTEALVDYFRARRDGLRGAGVVAEGTLVLVDPAGVQTVLPATHSVLFDEGCRLEVAQGLEGELAGAFVVARAGAVKTPPLSALTPVGTLLRHACPLLAARSGAVKALRGVLETLAVDPKHTSLGRMGGEVAYVVGGKPWETSKPEVWLDKSIFLPLRIRWREGEQTLDVRLAGYSDPASGELHPRDLELWIDDRLRVRFTTDQLDVNRKLDRSLFE